GGNVKRLRELEFSVLWSYGGCCMNMTDPIADMLTRICNAVSARHARVLIPSAKMKLAIARVLKEEGYIKDIEILKDNPQGTIRITLRYVDKKPVLTQLKRVSKPGLR